MVPPAGAGETQVISAYQNPTAPPAPTAEPPATPAWGAPAPPSEGATTVMPAWQPGAGQPGATGAPPVGDTMPLPGAQPAPAGGSELMIETGPDTGQSFRMASSTVRIGRSPDNDLILRDPATSGHHARIERRGAQFYIIDLGSTNGSLVNGEPVQEKELKHGDKITIGQNAVKFNIG